MIEHELINLNNYNDDICNLSRFIEFSKNNYPMSSQMVNDLILLQQKLYQL